MYLDGGDILAEWATSYHHCSRICSFDPFCKMWTYYLKDNLKKCYLKKASTTMIQMSRCENCISGLRDSRNEICNKNCKFYCFRDYIFEDPLNNLDAIKLNTILFLKINFG